MDISFLKVFMRIGASFDVKLRGKWISGSLATARTIFPQLPVLLNKISETEIYGYFMKIGANFDVKISGKWMSGSLATDRTVFQNCRIC